jgi:hypothetical protein
VVVAQKQIVSRSAGSKCVQTTLRKYSESPLSKLLFVISSTAASRTRRNSHIPEQRQCHLQCVGSGSTLDPHLMATWTRIRMYPDSFSKLYPDLHKVIADSKQWSLATCQNSGATAPKMHFRIVCFFFSRMH